MHHQMKEDARKVKDHINGHMTTKTWGPKDYAHLGGAAALVEHLDKHGDPVKWVRKELKDALDYLHKYETSKNPMYLTYAKYEIDEIDDYVAMLEDPKLKEEAMRFVHEPKEAIHKLDKELRSRSGGSHIPYSSYNATGGTS